jgi:hypothetical protein
MKRLVLLAPVLAALALPAGASAKVVELGAGATPDAKPDCPQPDQCQVAAKVTGYMGRSGALKSPFVIPRAGVIVAFTVDVGNPSETQLNFFKQNFGEIPYVRLSILRKGKKRKRRLDHRVMAQSRRYRVDRYFGSRPTFAFSHPLRVHRGYIVALTVPTWAPVFAPNLPRGNWWRSSRRKGECGDVTKGTPLEERLQLFRFGCTYFGARLLYTATYIPDPRRTDTR